ncbi:MAG: hypothetical protein JW735_14305 [Prolixibacteraceae bacterium]|jgi:hypothetical protein|nr:hypothetical protein [Prolixibacteraceae bacterium]
MIIKKLLLIFALAGACCLNSLLAQDQLITVAGDTIHCKITELGNNQISFQLNSNGIFSEGKVSKDQLKTYSISEETFQELNHPKPKTTTYIDSIRSTYQRNSISVNAGYGYLTASANEGINNLLQLGFELNLAYDFYENIRNVRLLSLSYQYLPLLTKVYALSIGFNYMNQYNSSSITGNINVNDGVHFYYGSYSEQTYVNYYGILLKHQFFLGKSMKSSIYLEHGSGLLSYNNKCRLLYTPYLLKSFSTAASSKLGFETRLAKHLALNIDAGYFLSILNRFTHIDSNNNKSVIKFDDYFESLGKFTFTAGLTYKF